MRDEKSEMSAKNVNGGVIWLYLYQINLILIIEIMTNSKERIII